MELYEILGIIGLILGLNATLLISILMCCTSFAYVAWYRIAKKKRVVKVPLAPFITVALLITVSINDVINYAGQLI